MRLKLSCTLLTKVGFKVNRVHYYTQYKKYICRYRNSHWRKKNFLVIFLIDHKKQFEENNIIYWNLFDKNTPS